MMDFLYHEGLPGVVSFSCLWWSWLLEFRTTEILLVYEDTLPLIWFSLVSKTIGDPYWGCPFGGGPESDCESTRVRLWTQAWVIMLTGVKMCVYESETLPCHTAIKVKVIWFRFGWGLKCLQRDVKTVTYRWGIFGVVCFDLVMMAHSRNRWPPLKLLSLSKIWIFRGTPLRIRSVSVRLRLTVQ